MPHVKCQCSTKTAPSENSSKVDTLEHVHAAEKLELPPTQSHIAAVTQRRCNVAEILYTTLLP